MVNTHTNKRSRLQKKGFALISALSIMVLLVMITVGMLSLSTSEVRRSTYSKHQLEAQANARMALAIALGELQKFAGQDQRITATASILDPDPSTEEIEDIANPNLLGVWKNTNSQGYHLVGKDNSTSSSTVYGTKDYYKDLRFSSDPELAQGKWKDSLRLTWLASFQDSSKDAHKISLDEENSVTLVGAGTLGKDMQDSNPKRFEREKLAAQKIQANVGRQRGAYAWAVIDNSQKASIKKLSTSTTPEKQLAASTKEQLSGLEGLSSPLLGDYSKKYTDLDSDINQAETDVISYKNTALSTSQRQEMAQKLGEDFNHFTDDSAGLFTDPINGGIKKDLTPLLFGSPKQDTITFNSPSDSTAKYSFSSSNPIIPGGRHLSHGPSFDALRYWGKLKYLSGLQNGSVPAQTTIDSSALRRRPTQHWRAGQNDGYTFKAKDWAAKAPKLYPVMTDARYHYYFGLTSTSSSNRLRTHILPRVCMWNPYNTELQMPEMMVLMPSFFYHNQGSGDFVFHVEPSAKRALLNAYPTVPQIQEWKDHTFAMPCGKSFPDSRFLAFRLEPTTIPAGECLVFSPKVDSGTSAGGLKIAPYNTVSVVDNVLSASEAQGENHFYFDPTFPISIRRTNDQWHRLTDSQMNTLELEAVTKYDIWGFGYDNFNFVLKSSNSSSFPSNVDARTIAENPNHPTLQLFNGSNGGAESYWFWYWSSWWGNSQSASGNNFGNLEAFENNPTKDAPSTHSVGSKLLWVDESATEGNAPPLRVSRWTSPSHIAYNPSSIINWNVRPQLISRSPASMCAYEWYVNNLGAWMT